MSYIYHLKPHPFEGSSLMPLNSMPRDSDLYKRHAEKYIGREDLMEENIPFLNCKWNDVVQFSALDPQLIANELKKIQTDLKVTRGSYFKIPSERIIDNFDAVVFDRKKGKKGDFTIKESEILPFSHDFEEVVEVPTETINYWIDVKENGGKYLWFPFIPHIFVKGSVDITEFEVCEIKL